jgi:hypothetical protein
MITNRTAQLGTTNLRLKRGRPQQRKQEERKISYIAYLPYRYGTFIPRLKRAAAAEKKKFSENCDKVVLHLKTLLKSHLTSI